MDGFKKPEMILSVTNTVGLIGSITYFYKKTNGLQEKIDEIESKVLPAIDKFIKQLDHKAHIDELATHINKLHGFSQHTQNILHELDSNMESLRDDIGAIVESIRELGGTINLPSEKKSRKKKPRRPPPPP